MNKQDFKQIDLDYIVKTAEKLINTPSPSGFTTAAMRVVENELERFAVRSHYTKKGALLVHIKGEDSSHIRCITSHLDTLGAMVSKIKASGRLELRAIGGYAFNAYEGENCTVHTMDGQKINGAYLPNHASVHIYGDKTSEDARKASTMEVRLDECVSSIEDVKKLGINIGDYVSFEPRFMYTKSGYIKSRYLDDKLNCAALLGYVKFLKDTALKPRCDLYIYFSNYEEIGHGISYLPEGIDELIALDIGLATGDSLDESKDVYGDEHKVAIAAADSTTSYDLDILRSMVALAKEYEIEYTISIYPHYGSDASGCIRRGCDFKIACIGPAIDATHHYERTHIKGVEETLKLIIAYL